MIKDQINQLLSEGRISGNEGHAELIETHISWVLLCSHFVFKIKKPVHYSFLDFSSLERRKYFCEREIELNRRLTKDIYVDVLPVRETAGRYEIGYEEGEIIDYAVRMRKVDRSRQMDMLLLKNKVTAVDMEKLAEKIAAFHLSTEIIHQKDLLDVQTKFMDLEGERGFLNQELSPDDAEIIDRVIKKAGSFIGENRALLENRLNEGFTRDCHGDLHSRNIFLLPEPQPFDCIEFNDDYRQIDVLNDIAFLCMDLDYFNRKDLSDIFISNYNRLFNAMRNDEEKQLFTYFKSYRANIRAKVNSLRARSSMNNHSKNHYLLETGRYLRLMEHYINTLAI
jgi:uncharacterized protein